LDADYANDSNHLLFCCAAGIGVHASVDDCEAETHGRMMGPDILWSQRQLAAAVPLVVGSLAATNYPDSNPPAAGAFYRVRRE
jgi:hypothetical protein